ncbi:Wzy polymerase domain-containing protein [Aquabacterium sp. J223]|nr:Wzy polymerase domain-containing protein [Aquabacterium sp. J223]
MATLLLWAAVALVFATERRWVARALGAGLLSVLVFADLMTASRTGAIGMALLCAWGAIDHRLASFTRRLLLASPLLYGAEWLLMRWWSTATAAPFMAADRLQTEGLSSSRYAIWSNTLDLIAQQPWTGVGWGRFNFAWSLTPFPGRPPELFDHAHNLPLHLMAELGIPLGGAITLGLLWSMWRAFRRSWAVAGEDGIAYRAAFMMLVMVGLHSLLEYPLWYLYFLLPTAWLLGLCLGAPVPGEVPRPASRTEVRVWTWALRGVGLLAIAGAVWAWQQYMTVSVIFQSRPGLPPLAERIAEGQRSPLFGHQADYAQVTMAERPSELMPAFDRPVLQLLDARLMTAWAKAFAERGELDKARHLAARMREFGFAAEFFAPCTSAPADGQRPWQCEPPSRLLHWREFLPPQR